MVRVTTAEGKSANTEEVMTVITAVDAFRATPRIDWHDASGPAIVWVGNIHWLTWRERFALWRGKESIETIAMKRWPNQWAARSKILSGQRPW